MFQGIPVAKLVVQYCTVNNLPHMLQKYLDMHKFPCDVETTQELLKSAGGVHWAQWLLLSRIPSQAFAAAIANARAILPPETKIESIADIAKQGSPHMLLSVIADAPGRLTDVIESDAPDGGNKHARDLPSVESAPPKDALCSVEPCCTMEALEASLKSYPTLLSSLQGVKTLSKYKGKTTKQEYLKWRERIFGVDDINLMNLVPNKEESDFSKLLKVCEGCPDADSGNDTWTQEVSRWEQETVVDLHEWLGMITSNETGNGSALGVCYHLLSGHPLAALKWYLLSKEDQVSLTSLAEKRRMLLLNQMSKSLVTTADRGKPGAADVGPLLVPTKSGYCLLGKTDKTCCTPELEESKSCFCLHSSSLCMWAQCNTLEG